MKRRSFIKRTATGTLPLLLNGLEVSAKPNAAFLPPMSDNSDRILVIVQLNGGNDGLNMLTPLDQYDNLARVRSNIILPKKQLLHATDKVGFHPQTSDLLDLFNNDQLSIIQSVGYPSQNRSHFRSTDIWTSGSPADENWQTGWLGRYFRNRYANYPKGFPNSTHPHPLAITMGNVVSSTCQGPMSNYSVVIDNPYAMATEKDHIATEASSSRYGNELTFLRNTIGLSSAYSKVIMAAAKKGNNAVNYPENNSLAAQLKNVALLISGGLKTQIYIVDQGGYDTHGDQVVDGNPAKGVHAELLKELSQALGAFQKDINSLGLRDRVIGMTFSEFGRRICSNDSLGTDHGTAAPMLIFGACISSKILGTNPSIRNKVDRMEGVAMQFDFRDVYGSIMRNWFQVEFSEVQQILHKDFRYLSIL